MRRIDVNIGENEIRNAERSAWGPVPSRRMAATRPATGFFLSGLDPDILTGETGETRFGLAFLVAHGPGLVTGPHPTKVGSDD